MSNFVSNSDANALMSEIGKKKLTVTDVMPLAASAANEGIPYLYLGATTQDFTNGSIYECQEATPATDPKTYEWVEKYQSSVDLTYYKRIWGGTEAGWELLTDEQKAQYEYTFFKGDSDYTLSIVDAVTKGDMHPVTSNAVAEEVENINSALILPAANTEKIIRYLEDGTPVYCKHYNQTISTYSDATVMRVFAVSDTMNVSKLVNIYGDYDIYYGDAYKYSMNASAGDIDGNTGLFLNNFAVFRSNTSISFRFYTDKAARPATKIVTHIYVEYVK